MRKTMLSAGAMAMLAGGPAMGQATMMVPTGGGPVTPVPQSPPVDPADTPEEIAKDAARDLKDTRFYNKPGATRAEYDAAWQECRLIARGSRTPSGMVPFYYNPAVISPLAAGIGGGIGGMIGAAIAQGKQRRDNRRSCLLIRGWRMVETPSAEATRIAAMTDADRDTYFNTIVGAKDVRGEVTELKSFTLPEDPALRPATPFTGQGAVWLGKKVDPAVPVVLGPNEGAVVIAYRRVEAPALGRSGSIDLLRYDAEHRDVVYRPKDWKKQGDKTTYTASLSSRDKKAAYEVQVLKLTPGDYVINSTTVGAVVPTSTNCFGAPTFRVGAGEVVYLGDFVPYMGVKLSRGDTMSGLVPTNHIEDARRTLAGPQPALAGALKPATIRNGATYACSGITMTRWDIAGVPDMPPPPPAPATVAGTQ
ncbi:hypothetical protein [Sphingomonas sp. RS2018]